METDETFLEDDDRDSFYDDEGYASSSSLDTDTEEDTEELIDRMIDDDDFGKTVDFLVNHFPEFSPAEIIGILFNTFTLEGAIIEIFNRLNLD